MSAQTKKASKKNKLSPNGTELESQFYVAQRAKSSRTSKPTKLSQSSNGNCDGEEIFVSFSKESIPFIDKQIFAQKSLEETKEMSTLPSDTALEIEDGSNEKPKEELKEENNVISDITKIFDNNFMPPKHLFREKESKEIFDFITRCIKQKNYKSLLVTGPPGTGKTIVLSHLLEKIKKWGINDSEMTEEEREGLNEGFEGINVLNLNASFCDNLGPILLEIIKAVNGWVPLSVSEYKANSKVLVDKLKQIILGKKPKKLNIVMIDEADTLLVKQTNAKEISELLRVPNYPFSNVIFIVVSNTPDLLPKLYEQHKVTLEVEQVTFEPYSAEEMLSIFKHRLLSAENYFNETIEKNSLDNINWDQCIQDMKHLKDTDIRHVFRIIRKAYSNLNPAENPPEENKEDPLILPLPQQITAEHIQKAYEELYDESLSPTLSAMAQKHLMCLASTISLLEKKKTPTFLKKDLLTFYNTLCARLFLPKTDLIGLNEMISLFEAYNILELKPKEVKEGDIQVAKEVQKTPAKNANDEYVMKISNDKIKETLRQDGHFVKAFPE